jgi:hypothetical protein
VTAEQILRVGYSLITLNEDSLQLDMWKIVKIILWYEGSYFYNHCRENIEFGGLWQSVIANNEGPRDSQVSFIRESII